MDFWQNIQELVERVSQGETLTTLEGLKILHSNGAEYTAYMAGAHHLKELAYGDTAQLCSIINAKSGRCMENCSFCAQSAHHQSSPPVYPLKSREEIIEGARIAQEEGSHCYGIVTSGTQPSFGEEFDTVLSSITEIRDRFDVEPSASLGLLTEELAEALAGAGCVTYHHNLETARSFFPEICNTHDYEEDVKTVKVAKAAGMKVCCGGIFGLGESHAQRVELAATLRELMFRYFLPEKPISICGGRETNLRELQSWIFMAGASGTMIGNYLTTSGRNRDIDLQMFKDIEVTTRGC
jgi:biotin synthase